MVEKLINVMTEEFLNPFDESLDSGELYNLSSGIPVAKEMVHQILSVKEVGQTCYQNFLETRLQKKENKIHDPIKRQKLALFKNTEKKVLIHRQQRQTVIEMNMNILGTLLAYSAKRERAIDFKNALTYPLGPIPLALAHPDGSRRTTTKSQLMDEILTYCNDILKPEGLVLQVPRETHDLPYRFNGSH